jgi:hypothetical protein
MPRGVLTRPTPTLRYALSSFMPPPTRTGRTESATGGDDGAPTETRHRPLSELPQATTDAKTSYRLTVNARVPLRVRTRRPMTTDGPHYLKKQAVLAGAPSTGVRRPHRCDRPSRGGLVSVARAVTGVCWSRRPSNSTASRSSGAIVFRSVDYLASRVAERFMPTGT